MSETRDITQTDITMARDILETEMHSGLIFESEKKISRSDMVLKMLEAGESVFSVTFNKKVDDQHIKNVIATAGDKPDLKQLSKEMILGKEH